MAKTGTSDIQQDSSPTRASLVVSAAYCNVRLLEKLDEYWPLEEVLLHLGLNAFSKAGCFHCQGPLPVSLLSGAWKGG